jgi:alpha-D-xyloside xylohydrolase
MNAKGIYEGQRTTDPDKRVFILTRSAFAGQQRYAAATWSGDLAARWDDLRRQVPSGLNFALSGIPWWTTDVGGFSVESRFSSRRPDPEAQEEWREFMTRWFQFGTFCPLLRVHGEYPYREMFEVAPDDHPAYKAMKSYDELRYRLMPYIYSIAGKITHEHYTIMRPLIMDFAADTAVRDIGDQFMFGPAILVNPVSEYKARSRTVYLPAGAGWFELRSGAYHEGGQTIEVDAPYSDIPLFVKEGSIIPFGPAIQYYNEKEPDPIRLTVYTGANGSFTLYEDENVNYNYENGAFSTIPFIYHENSQMLIIGERSGSFPGMLEERTFEIVWVNENNTGGLDLNRAPDETVLYTGEEIIIER